MKYLVLIWAGLFRKPVRTVLTIASVFIAFLLFGLLQSVARTFSGGVEIVGVDRLIVAPKYSIIDLIPVSNIERIKQLDGVEIVAHQTWFGGTFKDPSNFFPRWPVPPKEFLDIYTEYRLSPEERQAFIDTRTGAIVGSEIALQYELKIGDRIPIIPDIWPNKDNGPWEFDLVGIFDTDDTARSSQMFINYEYFDEYRAGGQGGVSTYVLKIADPDQSAALAKQIDTMFANSSNETKTSTEQAYNQMFANQVGDIGFIMTAILSAVFFTILLLTGNTMAQAIRERIPELAILKTVGFTHGAVLMVVVAESVLMTLIGGCLGLALATAMMPMLGDAVLFFNDIEMTVETLLFGVALAIGVGVIVGVLPGLKAMRLRIVDALGEHQ